MCSKVAWNPDVSAVRVLAQKLGYQEKSCLGWVRGEGITSMSLNQFSKTVVSHTL